MKYITKAIGVRTTRIAYSVLAIMTRVFSIGKDLMEQTNTSTVVKNIVLVHGGLVDGSGWKDVYKILKEDGYTVSIVQEPTISLPDDVAVTTKRVIDGQNGSVILVGHSYGGVVITEAGNDPKVAGLVYVTAFAPDKGESAASLIKNAPSGGPAPPILPPQDGYIFLDKAKFCFTHPCGPHRKPGADKRTRRPGTSKFVPVPAVKRMRCIDFTAAM
jgi:pimeloyl-ACP methyl ester carboxylesterase